MNERVLVTGGAGFIGSHLANRLVREGATVRVFDNLSTGSIENLSDTCSDVDFVEGDLRDADAVRRAVAGCDIIFHQAALGSVPRSVKDPITTHAVNATGTLHLLVAARDAGVRRVVFASSSSIYGQAAEAERHEEMCPAPISPYALSKYAAERSCLIFSQLYGLETIALRYFNVFGPCQTPYSEYAAVIPKFIERMLRGEAPLIYGDGRQSRDFTYVDNVVAANLLAAHASGSRILRPEGNFYNIACGGRTSLLELVDVINAALGTSIDPEFAPARPGDIEHAHANIALAREILGFEPRIAFEDGIQKTIAWFSV